MILDDLIDVGIVVALIGRILIGWVLIGRVLIRWILIGGILRWRHVGVVVVWLLLIWGQIGILHVWLIVVELFSFLISVGIHFDY